MSVRAITPNYVGQVRDRVENFHGNILVFVEWLDHLIFLAPTAFVVSPDMKFSALFGESFLESFGRHSDWAKVDPSAIVWQLDGVPFTPAPDKTLAEQGIGHKSFLRFETPGLKGIAGVSY